jgi:acyl carrier protein
MADVRNSVLEVLHRILGDVALSDSTTAKDVPGWDSLKQVMILTSLEEHFGFQFSSREMDALGCVGDLVKVVRSKITNQQAD